MQPGIILFHKSSIKGPGTFPGRHQHFHTTRIKDIGSTIEEIRKIQCYFIYGDKYEHESRKQWCQRKRH